MKQFLRLVSVSALCLIALAGMAQADMLQSFASQSGSLSIAGGTAHIPVMTAAAKKIMTVNPDIHITIEGGGSGVGVQKAGEGLVQIGNTGRALSDEEVTKYGLSSYAFAIDGVTVIINPANGVADLTAAQVQAVFAGKITNWKDLGGADAPITLYTRDEASGTREVFWKKLLSKGAITDSANVVASNGAMKVAVSQDAGAIGYMSIGYVDDTVKAPSLDGVAPSQDNAKAGTYKVARKLFMNTRGEPTGLTRLFIDYIMSPDCSDIISAAGYIPLH